MNAAQLSSLGRSALKVLGGALAAYAVQKGWASESDIASLSTGGVGALMTLWSLYQSHKAHKT